MRKTFDATGREIHIGDRVRFSTWGMFDVWVKNKSSSGIKDTDPKYVTHIDTGTVKELMGDGHLFIRPDRLSGVICLNTTPSWCRPEFVEVIND